MFNDLSMFWRAHVAPLMLTQAQKTDRAANAVSAADHTYKPARQPVTTNYM